MKFNLENAGRYTIISYQAGKITILLGMSASAENERPQPLKQTLTKSFILTPDQLIPEWPISTIEQLQSEHLQQLINLTPELILIGSGSKHCFPDPGLLAPLHKSQIGYEIMDSQAACRTYNLLRSEGRHVVAAIIL